MDEPEQFDRSRPNAPTFDPWVGTTRQAVTSRTDSGRPGELGVVDVSNGTVQGIALLVVVGLAMTGAGGYMWYEQGQRVNSYESTEGIVLSSGVDRGTDAEGVYIEVTYEYTVDGETYEHSNVEPGPGRTSKSRTRASDFVDAHPEGETITVYYDPENPSNAYVLRNRSVFFPALAGFGALFTVLSLWMLVKRLGGGPA